jgi:hypothetical protein
MSNTQGSLGRRLQAQVNRVREGNPGGLVADLSVGVLRELMRNVQMFRSLRESDGIDIIRDDEGVEWCLDDIEYLIDVALPQLPHQQRRAIELCLIENVKEKEAAVMMGVSPTNPVAMYATLGLRKIVDWIDDGWLPRFQQAPVRQRVAS